MYENSRGCRMCGYGALDEDPFGSSRRVSLIMRPIPNAAFRRTGTKAWDVTCTNCEEGIRRLGERHRLPKPDRIALMRQLRRATVNDQLHALDWLRSKFARKSGE